ncbi:MAG: hypothetical protein EA424_22680 [Planctomycetaceae bacterium]|nr:MAG: hypothetical protein EA424_22680 [Planctomycetaceae bacterium]
MTVDALDGAPGVLSSRYAGPQATDRDNHQLAVADPCRMILFLPPNFLPIRISCIVRSRC